MKIVVDGANVIQAIGDTALVAPSGGAVYETARTLAEYAAKDAEGQATGSPYRLVYDHASDAIAVQARSLSASEVDDNNRHALFTQLTTDITNWATLSPAEKDAAQLNAMKVIRAIGRYLARQGE